MAVDVKKLAEDAVFRGIQPTKSQLDEMDRKELYDFTFLYEALKRKSAAENERRKNYEHLVSCIKNNKDAIVKCSNAEWTVTPHALQRFMERGPKDCRDLLELLSRDLESPLIQAKSSKRHRAQSLLRHKFEGARYYFGRLTGLLYVVVGKNVIKTCHRNESKRWKKIYKK